LNDLGHVVQGVANVARARDVFGRVHWRLRRRLPERDRRRHVQTIIDAAEAFRPTAIIILKGLHFGRDDIRRFREIAWTANINHDDFFSSNGNNWTPLQRGAVPEYDFVFVTRQANVAEIRPLNRNVELFRFAYYPRLHRPVQWTGGGTSPHAVDVAFVGTWERQRARMLEELVERVPARYAIWGTQWEKLSRRSPLRKFVRGGAIAGDDMAMAVGHAKISLGFLRKENRDEYTQRSFEIPACGGCLLAERTPAHLELFREGVDAEFFDAADPDELTDKVRELIADAARRDALRSAGALRLGGHTYADRLRRFFEIRDRSDSPSAAHVSAVT
jgi:hypothetical protein